MLRLLFGAIAITYGALIPLPSLASQIVVKRGDTLSSLAKQHNVSIHAITSSNGLESPNSIRVGQTLIIPTHKLILHRIKKGETLGEIAKKYETSISHLKHSNNLSKENEIYAGQVIEIATARREESFYKVKSGDFIEGIAYKFRMNKEDIISLNNIKDPNFLKVNQILRIPMQPVQKETKVEVDLNSNIEKEKIYHTIKTGENLTNISKAYGISIDELLSMNSINDQDNLSSGMSIKIRNTDSARDISPKDSLVILNKGWKRYGPIEINASGWKPMNGSYVTSALNKDEKPFYIAINCTFNQINVTSKSGEWKDWERAKKSYEKNLISDICTESQT